MAQFARPDNDDSIGSWVDQASGTTNIYQSIDESTASDTDYIRAENNPSSSVYIAGLSSVTDPTSSSGHIVRFRYQEATSGGGSAPTTTLTVELREGTTVIASFTDSDVPNVWTDGSFTLTGGEADNITDYTNLNLRFTASKTAGSRTGWVEVSFAEFEVPNVAGAWIPKTIWIT